MAVAKQLRSANVNVDIVNFGELEQNTEKLEKFIETVNKESNRSALYHHLLFTLSATLYLFHLDHTFYQIF